jgi:uncharacterized protein YkwD
MKNTILTILCLILFSVYSQTNKNDVQAMLIQRSKNSYNKIDFDSLSLETIKLINKYRKENGLSILSVDQSLNDYSKNWGKTICNNETMSHSDIESSGIIAENIYGIFVYGTFLCNVDYFNKEPKSIFDCWKSSPYHNKNMLNGDATKIGLYIYTEYSGEYKMRAVMVLK